jgi:hypothetical protein
MHPGSTRPGTANERAERRFTVTVEVTVAIFATALPALICPAAVGGRADQWDGYLAAPAMNAATM